MPEAEELWLVSAHKQLLRLPPSKPVNTKQQESLFMVKCAQIVWTKGAIESQSLQRQSGDGDVIGGKFRAVPIGDEALPTQWQQR
jgi:hypothetical protein